MIKLVDDLRKKMILKLEQTFVSFVSSKHGYDGYIGLFYYVIKICILKGNMSVCIVRIINFEREFKESAITMKCFTLKSTYVNNISYGM